MPSWMAVAAPADPERYLRQLAEQTLLEGERLPPWGGTVEQVGRALVAVGLLDSSVADAVAYEHAADRAGQDLGLQAREWRRRRMAIPRLDLSVPVVRPGPVLVTLPWAEVTVRYVRFCPTETKLAVTAKVPEAFHELRAWFKANPTVLVADDRGTSGPAAFHGSMTSHTLRGEFSVPVALSSDTAWLQLDSVRVDLPCPPIPEVTVTVENLPSTMPALAYLWHRLAVLPHLFEQPLAHDAVIEALVAVGALDPAEPELRTIELVATTLERSWHGEPVSGSGLPEPWSSVITPVRPTNSAAGVVPVAAVTPPVDDVVVAIDAVDAEPIGFQFHVDVTITPGRGLLGLLPGPGERLAWWAVDDRGGIHLGRTGQCAGSRQLARGTINFPGGIHPDATELLLLPTGLTHRAVVRVPLRWSNPPLNL